jgi:hypothetical protein
VRRSAEEAEAARMAARAAAQAAAQADAVRAAASVPPWEAYVRRFISDYDLSPAQANAAYAILKGQLEQARRYEQSVASRRADAERISDAAQRARYLRELNQPLERLFEELKLRLQAVLTAPQRARGPLPARPGVPEPVQPAGPPPT